MAQPIAVAPLAEQSRLVETLKQHMETVTNVENTESSLSAELTQLDQSILAKAFRGDFVPQDSGDEPASQLLHRIRTTREKLEAEKKPKKKATM